MDSPEGEVAESEAMVSEEGVYSGAKVPPDQAWNVAREFEPEPCCSEPHP